MDTEIIEKQLSELNDIESMNLINAIKNYLTDEADTALEGKIADLFEYFKVLPYKDKRIFLYTFKCIKDEDLELSAPLEEVYFIFQKKHIPIILEEVSAMPEDFQKIFYNLIYDNIAAHYNSLNKTHDEVLKRKEC